MLRIGIENLGSGEVHKGVWWRNLRERDLGQMGDNIKMDLREIGWDLDWIDWLK
jgi:hypothetical protein